MPKSHELDYKECCKIRLKIDIHGKTKEIDAVIDTGFTAEEGYGLKLPLEYSELASYYGTTNMRTADDRKVSVRCIPDGLVLEIEGEPARPIITIPMVFIGKFSKHVGIVFLKRGVAVFDGPREKATLTI